MNPHAFALMVAIAVAIAPPWATTPARAQAPSKPTLQLSDGGKGGLVTLPGGNVALWAADGRIQIKGATGDWSPIIPLGVDSVGQVVPDGEGILGWGTRGAAEGKAQRSIFQTNANGAVLHRWEPPGALVFSVASHSGKRWATISAERPPATRTHRFDSGAAAGPPTDVLVELLPAGKVEVRGKVETGARVAAFAGGKNGSARIDCVPANLTKSNYHFPYCTAAEQGGWRQPGLWDTTPQACGPYLIEVLDRLARSDLPHRDKGPQVAIRRLDNGETVHTRPIARGQVTACGAAGELLIGRDDIRGLSLPDLKPLWRAPSPGGRVVALARGPDEKLWVATASRKVVVLNDKAVVRATP